MESQQTTVVLAVLGGGAGVVFGLFLTLVGAPLVGMPLMLVSAIAGCVSGANAKANLEGFTKLASARLDDGQKPICPVVGPAVVYEAGSGAAHVFSFMNGAYAQAFRSANTPYSG
jgi:hypothetical protein